MKYESIYTSPSIFLFRDTADGKYYFTGIFGTVVEGPRSLLLTESEKQEYMGRGKEFLLDLYRDVEVNTPNYLNRFDNEFDSDPAIVQVIREVSYPEARETIIGKIMNFLKR